MEQTGGLTSLAQRLKEKTEQERIQTETLFASELENLRLNYQASLQNALHTMTDAMEKEIGNAESKLTKRYRLLSLAFGKKWIVLALLGFAFCLGMTIAGWIMIELGIWSLSAYRNELAELKAELPQLKQDCQAQRETLKTLTSQTWGLELREWENGRFIILPPGKTASEKVWTVGNRNAIKLE